MKKNIINSLHYGERVTSTYAEIYFDDLYCDDIRPTTSKTKPQVVQKNLLPIRDDEIDDWKSPSDHLIGIVDLKPPFTSKITRGKTHEGILDIGDEIVENERTRFLKYVTNLLHENDSAWNYILEHEKGTVSKKVNDIYKKIFLLKSKTMMKEIDKFYESSLQEIEKHLRSELQNVLVSAHTKIVSDLNTAIKEKMLEEKNILKDVLKKRYDSEVRKIKKYYNIIFNNELYRIQKLINSEIVERNDALKAFYRQIEAENMTSTMYIMSTERKKCRIKRFILDNYQSTEIAEKLSKIKQRQDVIDAFKEKEVNISEINNEWEEKIKNILRLFLKFIGFALKLLPEQTTFLLDLEKMVVLQLNEIKKVPNNLSCSILVEEDQLKNIFKFEEPESKELPCDKDPFVIEGDTSDPIPIKYGSREILPPDVDLPTIRLQRQYVYAKCHKFEEIKALLESQRCKCGDLLSRVPPHVTPPTESTKSPEPSALPSESSFEPLLVDDIKRLNECPARKCSKWAKRTTFPYLDSYMDFTEENFEKVQTILGACGWDPQLVTTELVKAKDIVYMDLPFAATKELYHHAETQYSSQENIYQPEVICTCVDDWRTEQKYSKHNMKETQSEYFNSILTKRKISLRRLIQQNPRLLKMFTDEDFDFVL